MAVGNLLMAGAAVLVARGKFPIIMDAVFWMLTLGLVAVRYIDIARCKGLTSTGEPATLQHWRRYSVRLLVVAAVLYVSARLWSHS
jgi:hypothetical protein